MDGGDGCIPAGMYWKPVTMHLETVNMVNFVMCIFLQ